LAIREKPPQGKPEGRVTLPLRVGFQMAFVQPLGQFLVPVVLRE
jgi:hypothetical protein